MSSLPNRYNVSVYENTIVDNKKQKIDKNNNNNNYVQKSPSTEHVHSIQYQQQQQQQLLPQSIRNSSQSTVVATAVPMQTIHHLQPQLQQTQLPSHIIQSQSHIPLQHHHTTLPIQYYHMQQQQQHAASLQTQSHQQQDPSLHTAHYLLNSLFYDSNLVQSVSSLLTGYSNDNIYTLLNLLSSNEIERNKQLTQLQHDSKQSINIDRNHNDKNNSIVEQKENNHRSDSNNSNENDIPVKDELSQYTDSTLVNQPILRVTNLKLNNRQHSDNTHTTTSTVGTQQD